MVPAPFSLVTPRSCADRRTNDDGLFDTYPKSNFFYVMVHPNRRLGKALVERRQYRRE